MKRRFPDRPHKPHLLKIQPPAEHSFIIKGDSIAWNNPWHFHPEIELLYCISGQGTNYVGNWMSAIEPGELLLFGKDLPHTRQRDRQYYAQHPGEVPETIVIQFRDDFLGDRIFALKEFSFISGLLARAQRGLKFSGPTRECAIAAMNELREMSGAPAIAKLITLLDNLARSEEYTFLNHAAYLSDLNNADTQKINRVFAYVHDHFREHIPLATVAELTNLSAAAFCRYFKSRTRKSFMEYLTEKRIDFACALLMEGVMDVSQICFASGFNNLSNFNKQFKKIMQVTPSMYRVKASQKINSF